MSDDAPRDFESNRLSGRLGRYARVGAGMGGVAARMAAGRVVGRDFSAAENATELARALGGLKGPIMKVAQLLATIPDALPPEYTTQLAQLQSNAPPMGWAFVKRRMTAELGAGWLSRFQRFDREPAAAASLGQVHRAVAPDGGALACKLQYPDMASAVEADIRQLNLAMGLFRRMDSAIDTREIQIEIADRVREELDYIREARHLALYRDILSDEPLVRVPAVHQELSTLRLLTMDWLEGGKLLSYKSADLDDRNRLARAMFKAWWHPFSHFAVIHGDPHLGNYTVFEDEEGRAGGINLLDFGCVRIFPPQFVGGVIDLYEGLRSADRDRVIHAYETWGFVGLSDELIDVLNIWAKFIYGPLLEDRVRRIADGVSPGEYGRAEAYRVHQALREKGPVTVPREFVFMDRAAVGLGGVLVHLDAELNFYQLFNEEIEGFDGDVLAARQAEALAAAGLDPPS